jgi:hypothetical protein
MPKAAVDKHCQPLTPENEVRPTDQATIASPSANSCRSHYFYKTEFRRFVTELLHASHDV